MSLSVIGGRYNVGTSDTGSIKKRTVCGQVNLRAGEDSVVNCNSKDRTVFMQKADYGTLSLCRVLVYGKY